MNKRVVVLGATGMLGSAVAEHFRKEGYEVLTSYRTHHEVCGKHTFYFDAADHTNSLKKALFAEKPDCVINCIGVIKPYSMNDVPTTIKVNSLFPWELAKICKEQAIKLIHITTDCVFSGREGKYVESDDHDPIDVYGKTKSLGEPVDCMTLRTSIIGEEVRNNVSLIEWAKAQGDAEISGYETHIWSGMTTAQYAKCCQKILEKALYQEGLFHIFSNIVNKFELMQLVKEAFNLPCTVNRGHPISVDRSLSTEKDLCETLAIPSLRDQLCSQ